MKQYGWAKNNSKLVRAIAIGRDDEAAVKAEYIKIGGLIIPGYEETPDLEIDLDDLIEETAVVEAPKKAAKKVSKKK